VVHGRKRAIWPAHGPLRVAQALERLRIAIDPHEHPKPTDSFSAHALGISILPSVGAATSRTRA
jgi:hypothetical protein